MTPSDEVGAARMLQAGLSLLQIVYLSGGKETIGKKQELRPSLGMGRDYLCLLRIMTKMTFSHVGYPSVPHQAI
jgi:hypothetical protein